MADHSDSAAHKSRSDGAEENEEIIQFSNEDIKEGLDKCKRSLVGRLLADRKFSASTLESALYSIWRQPEEFKVIDHGGNLFQFFFGNEVDLRRMIKAEPWLIKNTPILEGEDLLTWPKEKHGVYSVSSGYNIAFGFFNPPLEFMPEICKIKELWACVWNISCRPKIKNFLWKVMHEGIAVKQRLYTRFPSVNPQCPRCEIEAESIFHCLCYCADSVEVWHLASLATPLVDEIPWKWWLRISKILKQQSNGKQKLELAANLVLSIWKACNELIFENSHKSPAMIVEAAGFLALNNSSR